MKQQTHIRVGHCIQDIESREIQHFESINKAKAHSRKTFDHGELRIADKLLSTETD